MDTIPLRDAIRMLRVEIMAAAEDASTQSLRFELGPIEMEFQVVLKKEGGGEAKLGFHIFAAEASLGANAKAADERTQKVKLTLNPVLIDTATGKRSKVDIERRDETAQTHASKPTMNRD